MQVVACAAMYALKRLAGVGRLEPMVDAQAGLRASVDDRMHELRLAHLARSPFDPAQKPPRASFDLPLKEYPVGRSPEFQKFAAPSLIRSIARGAVVMRTIDNFKFHRVSRLLAVVCVALTISAPFAAAYVATARSGAETEQTGSQVDRSKKGDFLRISPRQKPVEGDGAKQIEAPTPPAAPRLLA
jgi:hypothetical protein